MNYDWYTLSLKMGDKPTVLSTNTRVTNDLDKRIFA